MAFARWWGLGRALPIGMLSGLLQCAQLPDVVEGVCGNQAVESAEDCDTFAPAGMRCRTAQEEAPCHFACDRSSGVPRCYEGWGCAADGICRAPSGSLVASEATVGETASFLQFADFDGDGVLDLLAGSTGLSSSAPRVHYLNAQGNVLGTRAIEHDVIAPQATALDDSGRASVVFATLPSMRSSGLSGLATLSGTANRDFLALPYDTVALPGLKARVVAVGGVTTRANHASALLLLDLTSDMLVTNIAADAFTGQGPVGFVPMSMADLIAPPFSADIVDGSSSPCTEVLFVTASGVSFFEPCDSTGSGTFTLTLRQAVSLPEPLVAVAAADMNQDGHLDLLVSTAAARYVGFGAGDGVFYAAPSVDGVVGLSVLRFETDDALPDPADAGEPLQPAGRILAAGAVGDGARVVVVTSAETLLIDTAKAGTYSSGGYTVAATRLFGKIAAPWTAARVEDLNRDGWSDVVAVSASSPDVDLLFGSGEGTFARKTLSATVAVSALEVADVDGDGVNDIALVEAQSDTSTESSVFIAFGRAWAAPEAPMHVMRTEMVRQIAGISLDPNSLTKILILICADNAGEEYLSSLVSEGSRRPISPAAFVGDIRVDENSASITSIAGTPIALAVGSFFSPTQVDAAALAFDNFVGGPDVYSLRFWSLTSLEARAHDIKVSAPLDGVTLFGKNDPSEGPAAIVLRAADMNDDGVDEVYFLGQDVQGNTVVLSAHMTGTGEDVFLTPGKPWVLDAVPLAGPGSDLIASDVDRDGHPDLVVLCRPLEGAAKVLVLWNDGAGGFSSESRSEVPCEDPRAIGSLLLDASSGRELVISTQSSLLAVRSDGSPRTLAVRAVEGAGGGAAMATGDVNADGVEDIALLAEGALRVYFGVAREP